MRPSVGSYDSSPLAGHVAGKPSSPGKVRTPPGAQTHHKQHTFTTSRIPPKFPGTGPNHRNATCFALVIVDCAGRTANVTKHARLVHTCPREKTYPERRWRGTSRSPRHSRRHAPCVACVVARSHTHIRKAGFARQDCAPNTISPAATLPHRSIYVMQARRWRTKTEIAASALQKFCPKSSRSARRRRGVATPRAASANDAKSPQITAAPFPPCFNHIILYT